MSQRRNREWKVLLDIGKEEATPKDPTPHIIAKEVHADHSIINYPTRRREN